MEPTDSVSIIEERLRQRKLAEKEEERQEREARDRLDLQNAENVPDMAREFFVEVNKLFGELREDGLLTPENERSQVIDLPLPPESAPKKPWWKRFMYTYESPIPTHVTKVAVRWNIAMVNPGGGYFIFSLGLDDGAIYVQKGIFRCFVADEAFIASLTYTTVDRLLKSVEGERKALMRSREHKQWMREHAQPNNSEAS
jgi:hypothetical protein